uniref:Acyltransferase n=1 Tax=Castor canadensis TaxID=51338 RepID=A0A8C0X5V9_CASCN
LYSMEASSGLLQRILQVFAVLQWIFILALGEFPKPGDLGKPTVLYLGWIYQDRDIPRTGGRHSDSVCNLAAWRHYCDYFPISVRAPKYLDLSQNCLFGFHPHGIFSNFCTEATGFSRLFPGLLWTHLLMLPCWFQMPLFRDYIMTSGLFSSDKASVYYLLSCPGRGQVVVLAVGGSLEALEAKPGTQSLRIHDQKGLDHGHWRLL